MLLNALVSVWMVLLVQAGNAVRLLEPCNVDCRHYGTELGNKADDPFHCNMYYVCFGWWEWSEVPFSCPQGEMFDTVTKKCMREGYTCSEPCQKCTYECNNPVLGKASFFENCNTYLKCDESFVNPISCPPEQPYFDGNICQDDYRKCCSCKPYCNQEDAAYHRMVPDYSNCTNFYLCVVPGVPDETSHGYCLSGNFDQTSSHCSDDAACKTTCTNAPPDNGCIDELICEEVGYFPRCTDICDPVYFWCSAADIGHKAQNQTCSNGSVLDPITVICIPPEKCPV